MIVIGDIVRILDNAELMGDDKHDEEFRVSDISEEGVYCFNHRYGYDEVELVKECEDHDWKVLIEQVRKIDIHAASYLYTSAHLLDSFNPSGELDEVFIWEESLQGHNYWLNIVEELMKLDTYYG